MVKAKSRTRRRALGAAAVFATTLIVSASADVAYDVRVLAADGVGGTPLALNSVGAVLVLDYGAQAGFEIVSPDGSTHYRPTLPTGWHDAQFSGLSDPLGTGDIGEAWGYAYTGDSFVDFHGNTVAVTHPVVWNPLSGLTDIGLVQGAAQGRAVAGTPDGWVYCHATNAPTDQGDGTDHVVTRGFAWHPSAPATRIEAVAPAGFESVNFGGVNGSKVIVYPYTAPDVSGPTYVWNRATNSTLYTVSGEPLYTGDSGDLLAGPTLAAVNDLGESVGGSSYRSTTGTRTDFASLTPSQVGVRATKITHSGWVAGLYEYDAIQDAATQVPISNYPFAAPSTFVWNARTAQFHDLVSDFAEIGAYGGFPVALTEDGTVVGQMIMNGPGDINANNPPPVHVFAWSALEGLVDLTPDVVHDVSASDVANGAVVLGVNADGKALYLDTTAGTVSAVQRVHGLTTTTAITGFDGSGFSDGSMNGLADLATGGNPSTYESVPLANRLGQFVYVGSGGWAIATPRGATAPSTPGGSVTVQPDAANPTTSITFAGVQTPGETTVAAFAADDPNAPDIPSNFAIAGTTKLLDISTTATLTSGSQIHLAVHYDDTGMSAARENQVRLLHFVNNSWVDATDYSRSGGYLDTVHNIVYGLTTSLSPFAVVTPTSPLTAVGPANVWLGLKNSDDVGTNFDLLAEALKNGTVVGSGQVNGVPGGSSGFNNAVQRVVTLALPAPVALATGDTLGIRISVRIAATGHRSGTARLWFDDSAANSRFTATVGGAAATYFLVGSSSPASFALSKAAAGAGPKISVDVLVDRAVGGNPFKPFGTWNFVMP